MNCISIKITYAIGLFALILSACNPGTYNPILRSRSDYVTDTLRTTKVVNSKSPGSDEYHIRVADMLSIVNKEVEEITDGGGATAGGVGQGGATAGGFRVEEDGTVNIPKIGKVPLVGLTRKEATDKVQDLFKAGLLKEPVIDVSVLNQKVTILGEVSLQGDFFLQNEKTTLVQAIGLAGGFTDQVDPKTLKIVRGDLKDPEIIYVNIKNLASLTNNKIYIQNHDIVYVEPDKRLAKFERSQSGISIFQTILVVVSTGLLVFTSFFK